MATDKRRDAATAGVGLGLVAGGGYVAEQGVRRAHKLAGRTKRMKPPSLAVLRAPKIKGRGKARALWVTGTGLKAVGAPASGVGIYNLTRSTRDDLVGKRRGDTLREGVAGTEEALREKARNFQDQPRNTRGIPLAAGAVGAGVGAQIGHLAFNRAPKPAGRLRHAGTAVAGVLGGLGVGLPLGNAAVRRQAPDYELTPTGVKRKKTAPSRPSGKARVIESRRGRDGALSGRQLRNELVPSDVSKLNDERLQRLSRSVGKADLEENYPGRQISPGRKRAAVYAAGSVPIPVVNDFASAAAAARMAPPEQRKDAFRRQLVGTWTGGALGAGAGAYGISRATQASRRFKAGALATARAKDRASDAVRSSRPAAAIRQSKPVLAVQNSRPGQAAATVNRAVRSANGSGTTRRAKGWLAATNAGKKIAKPFKGVPKPVIALGAFGGQMVGGQIGAGGAYTRTLRQERRRNARIGKAAASQPPPMTQRERHRMAQKKRTAAAVSTFTGLTGLGALGALGLKRTPRFARHHKKLTGLQTGLLTAGAGVGGAGSLNFAGVMRREADQVDVKVRKGLVLSFPAGLRRTKTYRSSGIQLRRTPYGLRPVRVRAGVG